MRSLGLLMGQPFFVLILGRFSDMGVPPKSSRTQWDFPPTSHRGIRMSGLSWAVLRHISSNQKVLVYGAHPVCCGNEKIHLQKLGFDHEES